MKLAVLATLLVYSAFAEEAYLFSEPPVIKSSTPAPAPVAQPLVFKIAQQTRVAQQTRKTHSMIRAAARRNGVPAAFVKSIVAAESNFDPTVVSPAGAIGLMQLMPQTAQQFGAVNPRVPEQNVDAGTRYLRYLMDKYSRYRNWLIRVIAAYNAGPAVVDRYRGVPPYPETRDYVTRVLSYLREFQREASY